MKKLIFLIAVLCMFSTSSEAQYGTQLIYNSGDYKIAYTVQVRKTPTAKTFYIQLGKYNISGGVNPSGNFLAYNRNTGGWYNPYNGFINSAWGMEFPYGTYDCQPIPFFAVSCRDSNYIFKYVISPAASCPDARSYYTTNGGANYSTAPFSSGGVILFPSGGDYNPLNTQEMILGFAELYGTYNINKTTNGGANWSVISNIRNLRESTGPFPYNAKKYGFLKYNPNDTAFVYANGLDRIFVSSNGGYSFDSVNTSWMKNIIFSPADSVLFGYNDLRLYRSFNKGRNWDSVQTFVKFSALEVNPDNPNILYGGDSLGVYISTNRGLNWSLYNNSFSPSKVILGISKYAGTQDTFFAVTTQSVYKVWASFIVGQENNNQTTPGSYSLSQNYPNPFNPSTKIKFSIPMDSRAGGDGNVVLKVYDLLGKEIETLVNESLQAGTYEVTFDGSKYPSGVYFIKLASGDFAETKKMILVK